MTGWALTETSFEKLLDCLGPDREQAGAAYEALRRKLARFFEWRGAAQPEERVDETFNRVARKLEEGVQILNPGGYCNEVARLVLMESFKSPERKLTPLEDIDPQKAPASEAFVPDNEPEDDRRLNCLEKCLNTLPAESRELIMEFYRDDRRAKIDRRAALAERLGINRITLGKRAQRVRDKLELCVKSCVRKNSVMFSAPRSQVDVESRSTIPPP